MHDDQTAGLIHYLVIIDCPSTFNAAVTMLTSLPISCENMKVELSIRTDGVVGLTDRAQSESVYVVSWVDKKS